MKKGLPSQMASKTSRPNRNVRDKQTIEENKAILRDFCTQKEVQLDMSGLKDPSTNFFLSLFESIYIQLDPDYDVKKVSIKDEVRFGCLFFIEYNVRISVSKDYEHSWLSFVNQI